MFCWHANFLTDFSRLPTRRVLREIEGGMDTGAERERERERVRKMGRVKNREHKKQTIDIVDLQMRRDRWSEGRGREGDRKISRHTVY
jgi:hypothetical protein